MGCLGTLESRLKMGQVVVIGCRQKCRRAGLSEEAMKLASHPPVSSPLGCLYKSLQDPVPSSGISTHSMPTGSTAGASQKLFRKVKVALHVSLRTPYFPSLPEVLM